MSKCGQVIKAYPTVTLKDLVSPFIPLRHIALFFEDAAITDSMMIFLRKNAVRKKTRKWLLFQKKPQPHPFSLFYFGQKLNRLFFATNLKVRFAFFNLSNLYARGSGIIFYSPEVCRIKKEAIFKTKMSPTV